MVKQDISRLDENMRAKIADENGLVWYDPAEAPFRLCGLYWYGQDEIYRRLPRQSKWRITEAVDAIAECSTGVQVRFRSDCTRMTVRFELKQTGRMDHMPDTGKNCFDLYIGEPGKERFFRGMARPDLDSTANSVEMMNVEDAAMRDFVLNFPLYGGVNKVEIGVNEGAVIEPPRPFADSRPVVIYGTSITQGGCASRPGMLFTNILSRKLNREFFNYGFSGNGRCESELAEILTEIADPALFIIDCDANCSESPVFAERLPKFIDILRRDHPVMPILVLTRIRFAKEIDVSERTENYWIQLNEVARRRREGDANIHFADGHNLLGQDYYECMVDGVHPTDLGFYRMAESLEPKIRSLIS